MYHDQVLTPKTLYEYNAININWALLIRVSPIMDLMKRCLKNLSNQQV